MNNGTLVADVSNQMEAHIKSKKKYLGKKNYSSKKYVKKADKIPNIKVLMYHRVIEKIPKKYNHWHYVTISEFKKQMKLIDRLGYTPITFMDYKLYLEDKLTLPAKPIILTFDDGYLDTFINAVPILVEMNMRAVIFVMGNRKLKRALWDELDDDDVCPLMEDEQILEAKKLNFEIGAHSLNHRILIDLSNKEVTVEIKKSKEQIESILNEQIYTFAYPYGVVDERLEKIVSDSGYLFACGVYTGSPKFGETMYDFRRLAINHHTTIMNFGLKLLLPYQYLEWIYHRAKSGNSHPEKYGYGLEKNMKERNNGKNNITKQVCENV